MNARYTVEQLAFLRNGFLTMRVPALTAAFNQQFGLAKTPKQIKSTLKNHNFKSGRPPGFAAGESLRLWTPDHIAWVRKMYPRLSLEDMTRAFNIRFHDYKTVQQLRSLTRNHQIKSGRSGHYESGHKTWNKGMKGLQIGGKATQFKAGHVPANVLPVGSERIDAKDGYTLIKVAEPDPHTGAETCFRLKHVVVWEAAHGPVPDGYVVSFKDGDRTNCAIDNLELLSRAELCMLNRHGIKDYPEEYRPMVRNIAKLQAAIGKHSKELS